MEATSPKFLIRSNRHFLIFGCRQEGNRSLANERQVRSGSDLHHFEVFLACAALGARPVDGHVFPLRAGRDAVIRRALFFVVDPAANQAHPRLEFGIGIAHRVKLRWVPSIKMAGQMVPNHARARQNRRRACSVFDCIQPGSASNHRIIAANLSLNRAAASFCAAPLSSNCIHVDTLIGHSLQRCPV